MRLGGGIGAALGAAAVLAVALLACALLYRWGDLRLAMVTNADLASPLALGWTAHHYSDAYIMTGNYGWWPSLWIIQTLRPLPGGRFLGEHLPGVVSVATVVALAWQARRVWGALSGLTLALVALSVGPDAWAFLFAWSGRAPTWWTMIALGAVAVAVVRPSAPTTSHPSVVHVAAFAAALAAGVVVAGDKLALTATLVPITAVVALLVRRRAWRPARLLGAVGVVIGGVALLAGPLARSAGYLQREFDVLLFGFRDLGRTVPETLSGLALVWRGSGDGEIPHGAGYVGAILAVTALLAGVAWVWRSVVATRAPEGVSLERQAWMVFWVAALAAMLAAFAVTQNALEGGTPVPRYLYGVPLAAGAVLAGLVADGRRRPVVALAVVLACAASVALVRSVPPPAPAGHQAIAAKVGEIARERGLTRGYGPYWSAYPVQLLSGDDELEIVPVGGCPGIEPYAFCPMFLHYVDKAYLPRAGGGSFVLIDPVGVPTWPAPMWLSQLPPTLRPTELIDVGEGVTMAIFDNDVATAVQPGPQGFTGAPQVALAQPR